MHHQIKKYVVRVFLVNFFSLLYLIDTPSLDLGFFSIQSLFYSINIYLLYFFILFETKCSFLSYYGLDFNFYKLIIYNLDNLNYGYIKHILYKNINFIYFLIASLGSIFFLEKINYNINFKKNSFYSKKIINRDWVIHALELIENDGDVRYLNRITSILALEIWYRIFIKKDLNPKKNL